MSGYYCEEKMEATMRKFLSSIRDKLATPQPAATAGDDYVTLEAKSSSGNASVIVRPFVLNEYEDIKDVLDSLRTGNTIVLVNIGPLKEKDIVELKRAINKLKKTCEACNGSVAGFGDDYIIATPQGASIYRGGDQTSPVYE